MSIDNESLSLRILSDLNVIFRRDPQILEFDIVCVEESLCNKSPVIHVDHRVAIESWCVKHLYSYIYHKFIDSRINRSNNRIKCNQLSDWTRALLLINPDLSSAWNSRKELIENGYLNVSSELQFSEIVLTRKPRSSDNFAYRQWIIRHMLKSQTITEDFITNELRVCLDASSRYNRNYYSWTHRIWVTKNLVDSINNLYCDLVITRCWLETHVSDYSCYHFRQFLLTHIYNHICLKKDNFDLHYSEEMKRLHCLLFNELELINNLLSLYIDQESLFMHRRFVLISIAKWFANDIDRVKASEFAFIDKQLSNSYIRSNQWHLNLLRRHSNYLNRNLNWNFEFC